MPTALIFVAVDHDRFVLFADRHAIILRIAWRVFCRNGLVRGGSIGLEPPE